VKYTEGKIGRIFVVRLENGDIVHECLEELAQKENISSAGVIAVGGADRGSVLVVGPEKSRDDFPVNPMQLVLEDTSEIVATGTIFPDEAGKPLVHMHMACGRKEKTVTGCIRSGVRTWHIIEVIIFEITDVTAKRLLDKKLGFKLLEPLGE